MIVGEFENKFGEIINVVVTVTENVPFAFLNALSNCLRYAMHRVN